MNTLTRFTLQLVCRFSASSKRNKLKCFVLVNSPEYKYCLHMVRIMTSSLSGCELKTKSHEDFREPISDIVTEQKVKLILLEFMLLKQTENLLPDELEQKDMVNLLEIKSRLGRTNYILKYIRARTKHELAKIRKQEKKILEKKASKSDRIESEDALHLVYRLNHNCLHFRIRDNTIRTFYAQRLAQVAKFGPALVLDCSFGGYMTKKECMNSAQQIKIAYGQNFVHRIPFDLHFCNLRTDSSDSTFLQYLEKTIPNLRCPANMITLSEQNYLDVFSDKRELIYLSPDAQDVMTDVDEDAVYIIGALVDLGRKVPRTMAKAKKEGIRCLKLPLDRHLLFKPGACKSLPVNQVVQILLEYRLSGDWSKAFSAVAKRAVYTPQEIADKAVAKLKARKQRPPAGSVSSVVLGEHNRRGLGVGPTH